MSLYRQPGRLATRTLAIAGMVALLVGAAIGFAIGRSTASDPSLSQQAADVRAALAPARDGLELVQTEYAQAVRNGQVVARTEYQAAQADVKRAQDAVAARRADLAALDAAGARALHAALGELVNAVNRRAATAEVVRRARAAQRALDVVTGTSAG